MRRWILIAALGLVALAAFAPDTLWAEGPGVRGTVPGPERIWPEPTSLALSRPGEQASFLVWVYDPGHPLAPGTSVTVPLNINNDYCVLSTDAVIVDETNWGTGIPVTVTLRADYDLPGIRTTVIDLAKSSSRDTHFDSIDAPLDVTVTITRPSLLFPFITRNWDGAYWETEPNDTMAQANGPIPHGTYIRGRFPSGDIRDYYWFELTEPTKITAILTEIPSGRNYDLILRDDNGVTKPKEGWYSAKLGSASERVETAGMLDPGIYYLDVYRRSGGDSTTPYRLQVWYK